MANIQVEIQMVTFDISDPEVTKVVVVIKHNDTGILLKNKYEKTFPARIPMVDLLQNHMFGENSYLYW
jgi:hypothetical protein